MVTSPGVRRDLHGLTSQHTPTGYSTAAKLILPERPTLRVADTAGEHLLDAVERRDRADDTLQVVDAEFGDEPPDGRQVDRIGENPTRPEPPEQAPAELQVTRNDERGHPHPGAVVDVETPRTHRSPPRSAQQRLFAMHGAAPYTWGVTGRSPAETACRQNDVSAKVRYPAADGGDGHMVTI